MTPQALADLHAAAFAPSRGWTPAEFAGLCASPHVHLFCQTGGFALAQVVADETELLTLAVAPAYRRQGVADALMRQWLAHAPFDRAFLEVAADNVPAQQLYIKHGFIETGRRRNYYARPDGPPVDAVLMQRTVTQLPLPD